MNSASTTGDQPSDNRSAWQRRLFPTWEQRKQMAYKQGWAVVLLGYLALGFALLFPHYFRESHSVYIAAAWVAFMLRTFFFHGGLLVALIVILAAWNRCLRLVLAALPLAVVLLAPAAASYFPRSRRAEPQPPTLKLMSVNLLMINRDTALLEEIAKEAPDIICLQEYTAFWQRQMQQRFGESHPYVVKFPREDSFGAAIYSRLPFVEGSRQFVPLHTASEPQIRVAVDLGGRPFALYNIHLFPPSNLSYTHIGREQFADLLEWIAQQESLPVVIAGDFNFTQLSPQAAAIRDADLRESHTESGWGRGATWNSRSFLRYVPGIRLDHVYYSPQLTCRESRHGTGRGSDHRPVIVTGLGWKK